MNLRLHGIAIGAAMLALTIAMPRPAHGNDATATSKKSDPVVKASKEANYEALWKGMDAHADVRNEYLAFYGARPARPGRDTNTAIKPRRSS